MGGTKADRAQRPSSDNVGMSALRWERIWAGTAQHLTGGKGRDMEGFGEEEKETCCEGFPAWFIFLTRYQ